MGQTREYHLDIGDVELAVIEWPGQGPTVLPHATGFHSRCWNRVVSLLRGSYIYAVELYLPEMNHCISMQDPSLVAEHIRQAL